MLFVGSDLLSGKREVTKLMPTQALQHPLEATASLLFVEGGPSNLLALTTHELGNICALDLVSDDGFQIVHVDRGGLDIIDQINEVLD